MPSTRKYYLILITSVTYLLAYCYLCFYHQQLFIFKKIIHESGEYNFLETTFYASHFLGHIPIHTILACYFFGWYLSLTEVSATRYRRKKIVLVLIIFLLTVITISLSCFGYQDTVAYISQKRQQASGYIAGGSWNLHLPSTFMMFLLIPSYLFFVLKYLRFSLQLNKKGYPLIVLALFLTVVLTITINFNHSTNFWKIWIDPRYQGHSVRELVTFGLIYLPLALFLIIDRPRENLKKITIKTPKIILVLITLFLIALFYQVDLTLSSGLGNITQTPSFAKNGQLSILYLLSAHFFEHFLDTIYFCLVLILLVSFKSKNNHIA